MKKKEYSKPALEMLQAEVEQIVALSVTSTQTSGLDENLNVDNDNKESDPWEFAW